MELIQYLTPIVVMLPAVEESLTIFLEMDHKEWLKTYVGTLKQQTCTSLYPRMIALCEVVTSQIKLLDPMNESIKTILCSIGRLRKHLIHYITRFKD